MKSVHLASLMLLALSCSSQEKTVGQSYNLDDYATYSQLSNPITLRVIAYVPACECGGQLCTSQCIGSDILTGDTLRVLTMCNYDRSILPGQLLKVYPDARPQGTVTSYPVWIEHSNANSVSSIPVAFTWKLVTVFGRFAP